MRGKTVGATGARDRHVMENMCGYNLFAGYRAA